jgi:hypothetical protein
METLNSGSENIVLGYRYSEYGFEEKQTSDHREGIFPTDWTGDIYVKR